MGKFLDYKVVGWNRIHLSDDSNTDEIIALLNKGCDIDTLYDSGLLDDTSNEFLLESAEEMTLDANDGYETIELLNEDGETLWDNSLNDEK